DLVPSTVGRLAQPAQGLLPPGILGHDPGKRQSSLPMDKAKELIASTGLPLPIKMRASVQPILQDRYSALTRALFKIWSDIGVEISIQTTDQDSFNESYLKNEGIDLLFSRWIADYDDPDTFTYSLFHSGIGELRKYFSSADLDEKMERARMEREPQTRERVYRDIENWMLQNGIILPLFHDIDYRVAHPSVQHLSLSNIPPFVNYSGLAKAEKNVATPAQKTLKGILQVPIWGELHALDPALSDSATHTTVFPAVFETLTRSTDGAHISPWLASSFQVEDGGKQFRFRLREGVKFHDGRRLTSRDVRYSFERALQCKQGQSPWLLAPIRGASKVTGGESTELEGFRILSASEFIIFLEKPLSFFPSILAYTPTAIIPEGTENFGGDWRSGCVGTGPFRMVDFQPGRRLKLEANPNYWMPNLPKMDGIEFTFGVSPAQVFSGFQSGQYSIAWNLAPSDFEHLLHESEFAAHYQEIPSLSTQYACFNIHHGPFADENLRQRFIQSLDWNSLIRRKIGRGVTHARSLTPPALLGYEPSNRMPGVPFQQKSPEPIEIIVAIHGSYESKHKDFLQEVVELLREKGFLLHILEGRIEESSNLRKMKCDLQFTNWIADYPDADTFLYSLLDSQTGFIGHFCGTPEVDRLLERSRTETDPLTRHGIYRQIEEIIQRNHYVLPLFHEQTYCFFRPEINMVPLNFFDPVLPYEEISPRG
ncbi:ABC transporter substrate-binding protein, partial [bacterium]|nr:ABC transporter substrate-binding protein [bacterium]